LAATTLRPQLFDQQGESCAKRAPFRQPITRILAGCAEPNDQLASESVLSLTDFAGQFPKLHFLPVTAAGGGMVVVLASLRF
jgi:hypothetical protein